MKGELTMLRLNGKSCNVNEINDNGLLKEGISTAANGRRFAKIDWFYSNDFEFTALSYLVQNLRANGADDIYLFMPYIPISRQDRVEDEEDVFTLKYFANMLNDLHFTSVTVLDPHSNISVALIDNVVVRKPNKYIEFVLKQIEAIEHGKPVVFFPDESASKRYMGLIKDPYLFGVKIRDCKTGEFKEMQVVGDQSLIKDQSVLIIDDISSYGGTFYKSATALKALGAKHVYLYVTHCENSILHGKLIDSDLITRIYTTDSIFSERHDLIEVNSIQEIDTQAVPKILNVNKHTNKSN